MDLYFDSNITIKVIIDYYCYNKSNKSNNNNNNNDNDTVVINVAIIYQ